MLAVEDAMSFDDIDRRFRPQRIKLECLYCGCVEGVEMEDSRTNYLFYGKPGDPDDPNRPVPLCRPCAKDHHNNWDHQWADYWQSLLPIW
jgi:hypothetical protein